MKILYNFITILALSGCAYFNTFYNAKQYYNEANKIRLEKDGQAIPIAAIDKYGKSIQKCKKVIDDFPESKFRVEALLLMAKSRYYRADYDLALDNLLDVSNEGKIPQIEEAKYWKALCKWKKGNLQVAMDELNILLNATNSKLIQSKCYLSLAEISKELDNLDLALTYLKKGAKLTQDRNEKGVIFGRLAEMAFELNEYDIANDGYTNVIAHSLSKEKIENAHLQILKILRIQKNYNAASRKIKGLLIDDKFKRIAGNLELELVKLYRAEGEGSEIETRLKSIVNDYQRTEVSAEAYYQLGEIYIKEKWDLDQSKEYFDAVSKESSRSIYSSIAKSRSKAISIYQTAENDINQIITNKDTIKFDSLEVDLKGVSNPVVKKTLPELYYQVADLEAFTFHRYSQSITLFENIISDYPDTDFKPKSMFALVFIYEFLMDSTMSQSISEKIIKNFPGTEYALYLSDSPFINDSEQINLFKDSEELAKIDHMEAIVGYKNTLRIDKIGSLAAPAAFSIGYYYDQEAKIDSALKYYNWVANNFPQSDQSKEASIRINAINIALSVMKQDTTAQESTVDN